MAKRLLCVLLWLGCERQATVSEAPQAVTSEVAPCGPDYPPYTPGMTVRAGALTVALVSAKPAPPRQKVPNAWDLEIRDAQGLLADVTLENADSFMPVHNHHGRTPPTVAAPSGAGHARIEELDFNMRGPWQVLADIHQRGTKLATVTFQVCVR